jgi:aspartyl-tRNA(Asn)/glutamyl-tRNA(Gln) amidotransferase subunit B
LETEEADILSGEEQLAELFEAMVEQLEAADVGPKTIAGWLTNEVLPMFDAEVGTSEFRAELEAVPIGADEFARLLELFEDGEVTNRVSRDVLEEMSESGRPPDDIIDEHGWRAITDESELASTIDDVLAQNAEQVEAYRGGKQKLFGYFIGQVMQATGGQADPETVQSLLRDALEE